MDELSGKRKHTPDQVTPPLFKCRTSKVNLKWLSLPQLFALQFVPHRCMTPEQEGGEESLPSCNPLYRPTDSSPIPETSFLFGSLARSPLARSRSSPLLLLRCAHAWLSRVDEDRTNERSTHDSHCEESGVEWCAGALSSLFPMAGSLPPSLPPLSLPTQLALAGGPCMAAAVAASAPPSELLFRQPVALSFLSP